MSDETVSRPLTAKEYLLIEREADFRSEFDDGRIYAMSGASRPHARIVNNITGNLYPRINDTDCETYTHDIKVKPKFSNAYYYPDVIIACGEARFEDSAETILLEPTAIFEVLSPSTASYDRVVKYNRYLEIETLRDYITVAQDASYIEHHFKDENSRWSTRILTRLSDILELSGVNAKLALSEIYDRIELSTAD